MNPEQMGALVRQALLWGFGFLAARGIVVLDSATTQTVVASLATLAVAGYGLWQRSKANQIAAVAAMPEIKKVVTVDPALAQSIQGDKVRAQ